jgi:hypothetical protein
MDHHLRWIAGDGRRGGCVFMALAYGSTTGPVPSATGWWQASVTGVDTITRAAEIAIAEGRFRADLDPAQFAYEFLGIGFAYHHATRLFVDPAAETRARTAFSALIERSR